MKKRVLIMSGYYLPSVKGGGPIQSIKNIVDNLSDEFSFYIVAADRDLGDEKPFENIDVDKWIQVGKANVYYTDISRLDWRKIKMIIEGSLCKTVYLNSFFDYKFTTIPLILRKINKINVDKIIIAPRGQFSPGALGLKSIKKKIFIKISQMLGLYNNLYWHTTAESEKKHIINIFKNNIKIILVNNLTSDYSNLAYDKSLKKTVGDLKVVFVSRIHPKKNLKFAIQLLRKINGNVLLSIYGPIEDKEYWEECKREISLLPTNIKVNYLGLVDHDNIINVFKKHHIFLFPTLGENFGHVISEALIGGCPVIISDQTPWRNLNELQIGWDISLINKAEFLNSIQSCVNMGSDSYLKFSTKAFEYAKFNSNSIGTVKEYVELFSN